MKEYQKRQQKLKDIGRVVWQPNTAQVSKYRDTNEGNLNMLSELSFTNVSKCKVASSTGNKLFQIEWLTEVVP